MAKKKRWSVGAEVIAAYDEGWAVVHRKHKPRQQTVGPGRATEDEIFAVLEGELEILADGRWWPAPSRTFALIRSGVRYGIRQRKGHDGSAHIVNILFRAPHTWLPDAPRPPLRLSAPWYRRFLELESSSGYDARGQRVLKTDDVLSFVEKLYRAIGATRKPGRAAEEPRRPDTSAEWMETWARAEDIIREQAASGLTVDELAVAVHVSPTQLRRVFLSARGMSPKSALTAYRIQQARALLASGQFNATQVAEKVGYSTLQRFSAAFKAATGESPLAFARRQ
ncbi:MAG TPA: AraC family transcriptional regulator [Planctomycetota bacterium]|nr:AraC family transcriptional regulator [Planctomycetota bacterium]